MADFTFEREVRTPHSEAYNIVEFDRTVGRVDIHYTAEMVHVSLAVDESLTQQAIQEIMDAVDEDIADAGWHHTQQLRRPRFSGRETAVYSDNEFSDTP